MVVLKNDMRHIPVINFGCISSKILWIKFRFSRVKVCEVVGYGSIEGDCEKKGEVLE